MILCENQRFQNIMKISFWFYIVTPKNLTNPCPEFNWQQETAAGEMLLEFLEVYDCPLVEDMDQDK